MRQNTNFICRTKFADRPRAVTVELFVGKVIKDEHGNEQVIDQATASAIHFITHNIRELVN